MAFNGFSLKVLRGEILAFALRIDLRRRHILPPLGTMSGKKALPLLKRSDAS
jgi:hypothetical protein